VATKAYFGFPRVTDAFTLSGGNWLATYPLLQLQTLPLSYVARTFDATTPSTIIIATASSPQLCSVVSLAGHNLSQSATIVVETWTDVAGTLGHTTSGSMNVWAAGYTSAELAGAVWTWFYRFSDPTAATVGMIKLSITDTGNTAGYIQAGFLEIADAFEPSPTFEFGGQYGFDWASITTKAIGGAAYVDVRPHPRVLKINFPLVSRDNSMDKFHEMKRQLRSDTPVLVVPLPTETSHLLRTVMLARQIDPGLSTIRMAAVGGGLSGIVDAVPMWLEEIIG